MLIRHAAHAQTLHGGAQTTLACLRQRYWNTDGRNQVRQFIWNMASLPEFRVEPSRPFTNAAVDFSGFIKVRST